MVVGALVSVVIGADTFHAVLEPIVHEWGGVMGAEEGGGWGRALYA